VYNLSVKNLCVKRVGDNGDAGMGDIDLDHEVGRGIVV
jgi:hypothetical protein